MALLKKNAHSEETVADLRLTEGGKLLTIGRDGRVCTWSFNVKGIYTPFLMHAKTFVSK